MTTRQVLTETRIQLFGENQPTIEASVTDANLLHVQVEFGSWYQRLGIAGEPGQLVAFLTELLGAAETAIELGIVRSELAADDAPAPAS